MLHPESLSKLFLVERGTDHAQLARNIGSTRADIRLAGNVVKVYPLAVRALYDTLRTEDRSEIVRFGKAVEDRLYLIGRILLRGIHAPACEHLVRMMMVVMIVIMVVTAAAIVVVIVMMLVLIVIMVVVMVMVVMVVIMIVVVVVIAAMVMIVVMMFMPVMIVIVIMVIMVVVAAVIVIMMMMLVLAVMMSALGAYFLLGKKLLRKMIAVLHSLENFLSVELVPRGRNNDSLSVMLTDERKRGIELFGSDRGSSAYCRIRRSFSYRCGTWSRLLRQSGN